MNTVETRLPGVFLIEPRVFRDDRGWFVEAWSRSRFEAAGLHAAFVQDNLSHSLRGVLRGLHYQHPTGQGKLVSVLRGEVFDVAVDIRTDSPTYGQWTGATLSAENARQMFIPAGFAHGFLVTGQEALFSYKCTAPYAPGEEGSIRWDDPAIGIEWPLTAPPVLSGKDAAAPLLSEVPRDRLPDLDRG